MRGNQSILAFYVLKERAMVKKSGVQHPIDDEIEIREDQAVWLTRAGVVG